METFDILLSDTEELQATADGDFKTGDCANKYIKYIVLAEPGHYKANPQVGAGMYNYINANANAIQIERAIRLQLEADVFKRPSIDVSKFPKILIDRVQLNVV